MKIVSMENYEPDESSHLPIPPNHYPDEKWEFMDFCIQMQLDTLWFNKVMERLKQLKGEIDGKY